VTSAQRRRSVEPMRRLALGSTVAIIAVLAVVQTSGGSVPTLAANQRVERQFAGRKLATVRVPPGATATATDPSVGHVLRSAGTRPVIERLIDRHRFWLVPSAPTAVLVWLRHHPPAGTRPDGSGWAGNRSGTYEWFLSFAYRNLPAALYEASLGVSVARAPGGETAVRADSYAAAVVPRPSWEQVPSGVSAISVTVQPSDGRASYPVATITQPALVKRLAAAFDAFPIAQPGTMFCPVTLAASPELRFQFLSPAGAALGNAAEEGCGGVAFSVGDRSGPALEPAVDLTQLLWSDDVLAACPALSVAATPLTHTPPPRELSVSFQITDTGAGACGLRGYPQISRLRATGRSLVPPVTRIPAGVPVTPPVVLVDPTWPATTSISWPAEPACKAVPFTQADIRLPGVQTPFAVRLRSPIAPCGDRLSVAPIG
jgi:hypothetical protein